MNHHFLVKLIFAAVVTCVLPGCESPCVLAGCNTATLPPSDTRPPVLTWTVTQVGTNAVKTFESSAGPVSIDGKYNIGFQADNPGGIKQITLDGSGLFDCETKPDSGGSSHRAPNPLPVSLPHQQRDLTPDPQNQVETHQSLVLLSFDISSLSCGRHHFGTVDAEYFVIDGTLSLKGTASNYYGVTSSGQLQLKR